MLVQLPILRCCNTKIIQNTRSNLLARLSSKSPPSGLTTDKLGLPVSAPWSVHALISSYPSPTISNATLTRLHYLAALVPPAEDTSEFKGLKREVEDLVRLVEAVRMVPNKARGGEGPPDGRVWPRGRGIALGDATPKQDEHGVQAPPSGRDLLKHAQRSNNGYYLVDASKSKK